MGTYTLTQLQYSEDKKGPWQLYVYTPDGKRYAVKQWFAKEIKYEDEQIPVIDAFTIAATARHNNQEVRVCDGGDMLVYHAKDGKVLYGDTFWRDIL